MWRRDLRLARDRTGGPPLSRWVGPGLVAPQDGTTVWVSMRGRLWKCAREQIREATNHESLGAELLTHELTRMDQSVATESNRPMYPPPGLEDPNHVTEHPTRPMTTTTGHQNIQDDRFLNDIHSSTTPARGRLQSLIGFGHGIRGHR